MKYQLVKPSLTSSDLSKLNFLANYMGYIFRFNVAKQSALFENEEHNVAFIQKDEFDRLFCVWKNDESIEFIDQEINIIYNMRTLLKLPKKLNYLLELLYIHKEDRVCLTM